MPNAGDTATIPSGKICTLGSTETVAGLTVGGTLTISNQLSVTTMTSTGTFNINPGGELDVMPSADLAGAGTINGRIDANTSSVYFNGAMTLGTGTNLTGSGTFSVYGNINVTGNISQNAVMALGNNNTIPPISASIGGTGSIDDSGEFDWNNGSIGLTGGVTFEANADLKIEGAGAKILTTGTLTNQCNSSDIGGTGTLTITGGSTFDNVGNPSCAVTIPTIQTLGPTSSFINDAGGFLDVQGTTTINGNFTNTGTLNVPGSLTLTTNPANGGNTVNLDSHVQVDGTLTLLGNVSSPIGFIEDAGSGTLRVGDGTTAGMLTVGSGSSAILSGLLEVTSTGTLNGGGEIQNNNKLQLDTGSTTNIGSYLGGNSGTLALQAGSPTSYSSLTIAGSAALSGTLELDFLNGYLFSTKSNSPFLTMLSHLLLNPVRSSLDLYHSPVASTKSWQLSGR